MKEIQLNVGNSRAGILQVCRLLFLPSYSSVVEIHEGTGKKSSVKLTRVLHNEEGRSVAPFLTSFLNSSASAGGTSPNVTPMPAGTAPCDDELTRATILKMSS
jgi:hypothetical protein